MTYPDEPSLRVSAETIYLTLFVQARGALKRELIGHLRRVKSLRRPRAAGRDNRGQGKIIDAVSNRERPAQAEDRAVPGHWEGDLLAGSANTHIATLVERSSRFVLLVRVDGKDAESVVGALSAKLQTLPGELRRSLTWDRGMELASHRQFTVATNVKVFFCDPQSPSQRGSNENTNGLVRQKERPPSDRARADAELGERIRLVHKDTEGIYGAPRIHTELQLAQGIGVGRKRVARLMRDLGLRGADDRRGGPRTTIRDPKRPAAPDLVDRSFARAEPDRLWVCDLKYVQTGQGFLFLVCVQDVFSRRIVGWSMRNESGRVRELERELRELKRANEILLAASSFFARELDPRLPW